MSAHTWACPTGFTPSSEHEDTPLWGPWHSLGHRPHALTRAFLQSHILPQILSQPCQRPGTIKKMFTHLPVMPNVWTLITLLHLKKINRHHLSQPEKSVTHSVFSQGFCPATRFSCTSLWASHSPHAAQRFITLCRWSWSDEGCLPFVQLFSC